MIPNFCTRSLYSALRHDYSHAADGDMHYERDGATLIVSEGMIRVDGDRFSLELYARGDGLYGDYHLSGNADHWVERNYAASMQ